MFKQERTTVWIGIILALLGVLIAVAQFVQSQQSSGTQDSAQSTQIAILGEQLRIQQEIATLQAGASGSGTTATVVSERVAELQGTATALSTQQSEFGTLVFSDNFENDNKNFVLGGGSGLYEVVDDGAGNKVLELSNAGSYSLLVSFGPQNISDCAIEYRVRIVNMDSKTDSAVNLLLRNKGLDKPLYAFSFNPDYASSSFYYNPPFENLGEGSINIEKGRWYSIRIEMDGKYLSAYIDNMPVIKAADSRLISGNLGFQIYSETIADFDDVRIWTR